MADTVYGAFVDFYGDIKLGYIKTIQEKWLMYGTRVSSGLDKIRYIFVIVPTARDFADSATLGNLDWVSLQTRETYDSYSVPTVQLLMNQNRENALSDIITIVDRTTGESSYTTSTLPIKIRLIHDPKKNNYLQYPDKLKLYQALNTFSCVVDLM